MPYRKPFYNALAANYDTWVVHAGTRSVDSSDRYCEIALPIRRLGSVAMPRFGDAVASLSPMKAVVAMFDLRWPTLLLAASRLRGTRRLLWGHRYAHRRFVNALRDRIMFGFDGVVLYGEEEVTRMIARGHESGRIYVAPNTIHVPNHADLGVCTKDSLLFVGRLQPRKRLDELISAFADIAGQIPADTTLDIVGDGVIRRELESLAERLGVRARVRFHGSNTNAEQLKAIFARAYAYVSPDNVGLGVLHAFAYGVPVITSTPRLTSRAGHRHGPEYQNLQHRRNSLIASTPAELRQYMAEIVTDCALRRALGADAYAHYSTRRTMHGMVAGFQSAIEGTVLRRLPIAMER